jgi:hypothetical protein
MKNVKNLQLTISTTYSGPVVEQFLTVVRRFNDSIGSYEQHFILSDDFTYSIKLSNGIIRIYTDELDDIKALPQERFRDIAARFRERKTCLS